MASLIRCPNCGIYNENVEYCISCGTLLSHEKRRELEFAKEENERRERVRIQKETSPSFYEKYKDHKFFVVRAFAKITHSIWLVFIAVGVAIAWIIAAVAA